MPRIRPPRWRWLLISLVISSATLIPLAYLLTPVLVRIYLLSLLTSPDPAQRARGLTFVAHHAGTDPAVARGAIACLTVPDDRNFLQIHAALDVAGQWRRPVIPDTAYLRWLGDLAHDSDREARIAVAQKIAGMPDLAGDGRVTDMLTLLSQDADAPVRYNVLVVAAELVRAPAARGKASPAYEGLIAHAADDPDPDIAREAWMCIGLLDPVHGKRADWRAAPPIVGQAILWTALATNPDLPAPALEALADPNSPPALRAMAVYALSLSPKPDAQAAIRALLPAPAPGNSSSITRQDRAIDIRAALAWTPPPQPPNDPAGALAPLAKSAPTSGGGGDSPLACAAAFRLTQLAGLVPAAHAWLTDEAIRAAPNRALAAVEGLAEPADLPRPPAIAPPMLRTAWARAAKSFDPDDLVDVFEQSAAPLRDLACVVAAKRFTAEQNTRLIDKLLRGYNDQGKCSGALLAGLTDLRPHAIIRGKDVDLLDQKMRDQTVPAVQQVLRLGLWMQGRLPEMDTRFDGPAIPADLPISTYLTALLKRRPGKALDILLTPRTDPPTFDAQSIDPASEITGRLTLADMLVRYRFARIVAAALPPDAPGISFWADPELRDFQVELLRDWRLMHHLN